MGEERTPTLRLNQRENQRPKLANKGGEIVGVRLETTALSKLYETKQTLKRGQKASVLHLEVTKNHDLKPQIFQPGKCLLQASLISSS